MKTQYQVPVTVEYVVTMPETMEQDRLYISKDYGLIIHLCLCGCGNKSITPIQGPVCWQFTEHGDGKVSLSPSILNNNCPNRAHYVLTKSVANML